MSNRVSSRGTLNINVKNSNLESRKNRIKLKVNQKKNDCLFNIDINNTEIEESKNAKIKKNFISDNTELIEVIVLILVKVIKLVFLK